MRPSASATLTNTNATIACVNQFQNGTRVVFTSTIGNFAAGTTYYVINRTATTIQLSTSSGGAAQVPNASGTTTAQAPWLEATNTFSAGQEVKLDISMGGFTAGTTYYVTNPTADLFQLSATSGGSFIAPSDFGLVYILTGTQHTNVVWIGDTIGISLPQDTVGVEPDLLGYYQIIAIPQITLVKESTSDDTFHVRSCVYRGLAKDIT
jgi:hypothetical protein